MALSDYYYNVPTTFSMPSKTAKTAAPPAKEGIEYGTAIGAGVGMLSQGAAAYYGAQAQKALQAKAEAQKAAARGYLNGYGFQLYDSPYQSFYDQYINNYLTGGLSQGQENALRTASAQGMQNINTTMANRGGALGAQLAMAQRNNADIAYQRAAMADQNVNTGMGLAQQRDNFNLQQWLEKQQADMRYKELMAQYA
jgi:hypothetical protein